MGDRRITPDIAMMEEPTGRLRRERVRHCNRTTNKPSGKLPPARRYLTSTRVAADRRDEFGQATIPCRRTAPTDLL
jgi:hypothetical protein